MIYIVLSVILHVKNNAAVLFESANGNYNLCNMSDEIVYVYLIVT